MVSGVVPCDQVVRMIGFIDFSVLKIESSELPVTWGNLGLLLFTGSKYIERYI